MIQLRKDCFNELYYQILCKSKHYETLRRYFNKVHCTDNESELRLKKNQLPQILIIVSLIFLKCFIRMRFIFEITYEDRVKFRRQTTGNWDVCWRRRTIANDDDDV